MNWNRRIEERPRLDIGVMALYLFVFMVVLKLAGVVSWGWWVIFAPIWGVFLIFMTFVLALTMLACIPEIWGYASSRFRRAIALFQTVVCGYRGKKE